MGKNKDKRGNWKPLIPEEIERIKRADWKSFHDPLCEVAIGDGDDCGCKVSYIFRLIATVEDLQVRLIQERGIKECPWCKGPLTVYHSGVMCPACQRYYERDSWWAVGCDEAHAHGRNCLVEMEPPGRSG